jgi:hypothetical protein
VEGHQQQLVQQLTAHVQVKGGGGGVMVWGHGEGGRWWQCGVWWCTEGDSRKVGRVAGVGGCKTH